MKTFHLNQVSVNKAFAFAGHPNRKKLRQRLCQWQQVRTWARLIREAESLWHGEVRELRRFAAIELSQIIDEVPPSQRKRINRWLDKYSASTRF